MSSKISNLSLALYARGDAPRIPGKEDTYVSKESLLYIAMRHRWKFSKVWLIS